MARPSRKLAIPQRAEFTAHRLRRDGHPKLLKGPLAKIDQPPAHDAMNRRDWAVLDHPGQRRAVLIRQSRLLTRRLAVSQTLRPLGVEPHDPIANDLPRHPADLGRLDPLSAIINRRQSQKPTRLSPVLRLSRQSARKRAASKSLRSPIGMANLLRSPR